MAPSRWLFILGSHGRDLRRYGKVSERMKVLTSSWPCNPPGGPPAGSRLSLSLLTSSETQLPFPPTSTVTEGGLSGRPQVGR